MRAIQRWAATRLPIAIVLLAVAVLYQLVSERLTLGLRGLVLALDVGVLAAVTVADLGGHQRLVRWLTTGVTLLLTAFVTCSTAFLVVGAIGSKADPHGLLRDAVALWAANVLVFALWYWQLDGGGPDQRAAGGYRSSDFVFPQRAGDERPGTTWAPGLVDYVFLAFTMAMAFSPTDTAVLSRRAKLLVMAQAMISLLSVAVLAARAINML